MIDSVTTLTLQQALTGLGIRQQVTANNIANLQTPGFTARNVAFESSLAAAVSADEPGRTEVTTSPSNLPAGINGNNVSLSDEIVTATKTGLQESLLANTLTSEYGLIGTVLRGGA